MTENKHTPWTVDMDSVGYMWTDSVSIKNARNGHVAHLTRGLEGDENGGCPAWPHAHLMAAAPDLLEALKLARQVLTVACGEDAPYIRQAFAKIDPAIAKAEGRT